MDLDKLKEELCRDEGLRLYPYKCSAGYWTIGYGHNLISAGLSRNEIDTLKHTGISLVQAEQWLNQDIELAIHDAIAFFHDLPTLSDARQRVITNMAFNLGLGGLSKFKRFRQALVDCDFDRAADEMKNSKWYRQVGDRAKRLVEMMSQG